MPRRVEPSLSGPGAFLEALRDPAQDLRNRYRNDPEGLAERLGLQLPLKPLQRMRELGVYDESVHGPITPGLRELVLDVCEGLVRSAAAIGPRGGGKVTTLSTPLPTPDDWTTMGEVQVGDLVMAADGTPTPVVWKSEVQWQDTYRVTFDDGSWVDVGGTHEWQTRTANVRRRESDRARKPSQGLRGPAHNRGGPLGQQKVTTKQILDSLYDPAEKRSQSPNHTIDNCLPLQLPPQNLPVDPYVLGYWLGDGTRTTEIFTIGEEDSDAAVHLLEAASGLEMRAQPAEPKNWRMAGLRQGLLAAGCFTRKHIPAVYLRASYEQRLALLQGLMDSDGTTRSTNNNCQFSQKDDDLVTQFAELVATMGWKYTITLKHARCQTGASYYHLVCSFNPSVNVYRLPRKAAKLHLTEIQRHRIDRRYIVDVQPIDREPLQCIQVAHPDHMYLVGESMAPTHNSFGVSFIEFFLVFLMDYDALNLGGSELQADQVYSYLTAYLALDAFWLSLVKGDPLQSKTTTIYGAWIRVLTASQKSVRSPHAGGKKPNGRVAGGVLVIDEEAEAESAVVMAALPTINTARPSVNIRCSTFHNAEGTFADLIDDHESMGYKLYSWDIFDICERCDCVDVCQSSEPCFREDHKEKFQNPDTGEMEEKLIHKAYCAGRARYADGWIPMEEVETLWRRMKRNHERWEIEAMGSRPSTSGHVIKDLKKYAENQTFQRPHELYVPGYPVDICVDWGSVAAGLEVWQEQMGDRHVLLHAEQLEQAGQAQIFAAILNQCLRYQSDGYEIAADIGGGGNYLNKTLREEHGLPVRDVNFGEEKESAVAAWNTYNEAGKTVLPAEFSDLHHQIRNWKRKNGRIQKGNDHLCDAGICYFAKFIDRLGLVKVRVPARTFSATSSEKGEQTLSQTHQTRANMGRIAVIRTFGGRSREI